MFLYDVKDHDGDVAATVSLDPEDLGKHNEHSFQVDQGSVQGSPRIEARNVVRGEMLCSDEGLDGSESYNDFVRPMEAFHEFCGIMSDEQSVASIISSLTPKHAGPFGEEEIRLLHVLIPHLQRGFKFHQRIVALQRKADSAVEALDRLTIGFLLVDASGNILMMNRRAAMILEQNDGLAIRGETLQVPRTREANRLSGLIHQAMDAGSERGFGGMMTVPRPSGRRAFQILVSPIRRGVLPIEVTPGQPAVAIFALDPETQPEPDEQVLVHLFGLTPAEARLAAALVQGKNLKQSAADFCLSLNTIRSQLQRVFDKTGTTRQGELVSHLWNSLARLRNK